MLGPKGQVLWGNTSLGGGPSLLAAIPITPQSYIDYELSTLASIT